MIDDKSAISRWATALAVTLLAGCSGGAGADTRLAKSEELITKGEYGAAVLEIKNALQEKPKDPKAELALARVNLLLSNTDAAGKALEQSQAHGADAGEVSRLRVKLMQQKGAYGELIKLLDASSFGLSAPQHDLARAQALSGVRRCPEAIRVARTLLANPETQVAARIVLAECYAQAGQPKLALELLETAVRQQPKDADAWVALGRMQQLSGSMDSAEASWRKAGELAPGRLTSLQQLNMEIAVGDLQLARGDLPAARATHGRMLHIAPQGGLTALFDARLLLAGGDQEAAVSALHELINRIPEFDAAHIALASALLAGNSREQALSEVLRLAQEFPQATNLGSAARLLKSAPDKGADSTEYWIDAASAQLLLGQPAMARLALAKAAAIDPGSAKVSRMRVELELRPGSGGQALPFAEAFAAKYPDDPLALSLLAQAQRVRNQLPEAMATLSKVQAIHPTAETAAMLYAVQHEAQPESALAPLRAWVAAHPDAQQMRALLADSLLRSGKNAESIAEYEKIVAAAPTNVPALNNLAWVYYLEKDARALETARKAWQLAPKSAAVADTYGWLLLESGAKGEGLEILKAVDDAAVLIDPESRYHLAAALARNGKTSEARERLKELLEETTEFRGREAATGLASSLQ